MAIHLPVLGSAPRFRGDKYLRFRCTLCGSCCTDTLVPITGQDLARLVAGTSLPAPRIATVYAPGDFQDGGTGLAYAELDVGPRTLGLHKKPYGDGGLEACRFFDGVCTVYDDRPVTCRIWPFTLRFDPRGQVKSLAVSRTVTCPHDLDGEVNQAALVRDWRWDDRQDAAWHRRVARWNRKHRGGTERQFVAYAAGG